MVVLAGDMNEHVGSNNVGSGRMHGGCEYAARNADGSRILVFTDRLNLVICNKLFMKEKSKMVTYVAGSVKSTVNYIIVKQGNKAKVSNINQMKNVCQSNC